MDAWDVANGGNGPALRVATLHGVRLKVDLGVLMAMRNGGVAFQAEQRRRPGRLRFRSHPPPTPL